MAKTTEDIIADTPGEAPKKRHKPPHEGPPCPKCGNHTQGWNGPNYQQGRRVEVLAPYSPTRFRTTTIETNESLVYTCNVCSYARHEICNNQR